ncbi:MAG: c-type cytochrome biogenesis protein CcsB [Deltaproteobacteria bacterium]|nr:c-type cytochrome biogenesis protein CcsB [Deltaproteobacteria bacterium]
MTSSLALSLVTFVYLGCSVLYLFYLVFKSETVGKLATWASIGGLALNTYGLVKRWVESYEMGIGHAPLSNLYESLVFFAWAIMVLYLLMEWKYQHRSIGVFATPFAFFTMAYASFSTSVDSKIQPLIPALKSNWLIAHVLTCFLGYAGFAVACGLSLMYLIWGKRRREGKGPLSFIPDGATLEEISYKMILIGFLLLSAGIITGSVWAHSAWGTYWSWDPKETWSLITWLVYATLLHARFMKGWSGNRVAFLSVVGFVCVLFTYFGVNFLLSGLHSYAAG